VTSLPPHLEALGADLERAARSQVAARRRRWRAQAILAVVVTLLVATGAGLSASGIDIVGWLKTNDPSSVRFLVDTTRTYTGSAPEQIECENVRAANFLCREIPTSFTCNDPKSEPYPCGELRRSQRVYWLSERVEQPPTIDRAALNEAIERLRRQGMSERLADRFTRAVEGVSDDFLARLNLLMTLGGSRTYRERPDGRPAVPPPGVPLKITCEDGPGDRVQCRDVAGATDIPLGAPVYALEPTADWVLFDDHPSTDQAWAEIEAFFGRELSDDEALVFTLLGVADGMTASEWAKLERALEQEGVID
jgi:hypothetical protein